MVGSSGTVRAASDVARALRLAKGEITLPVVEASSAQISNAKAASPISSSRASVRTARRFSRAASRYWSRC